MKDTSRGQAAGTDESVDDVTLPLGMKFWVLCLLLALCLVQYFWGLGQVPFYTRGEAREGLVVWEMHQSGNWVLPAVNGEYIPFKPPFFHWVGALISTVTGEVNELTIRLPSALFATLGIFLVYVAGSRLWNEKVGRLAAFILATNLEWWHTGTMAQVDMTLAFFMTAALLLFYFIYKEKKYSRLHCMGLALLLAFATLTKGPIGVVLPLLTIAVFLWLRHDFTFVKKLHLFSAIAVFVAVAGFWYALAMWQGGEAFFIRQIVEENLGTAAAGYGHHQPYYYFVPVFFLNLAPWSFFSPLIILFLYRRRQALFQEDLLFPVVWLVGVFVFFSLALGKRGVYIVPLFPAFALLFGVWWKSLAKDNLTLALWLTAAIGYLVSASVLFVLTRIAFLAQSGGTQESRLLPPLKNPAALNYVLGFLIRPSLPVWICLGLLAVAALLIFFSLARKDWDRIFLGFSAIAMSVALFLKTTYYPPIATERTLKPFALRLRNHVAAEAPLFFYHAFDYGTIFYSRRHIAPYPPKAQELHEPIFLLMWEEDWQRMRNTNDFRISDISEGRGPVDKHHLVLVESPGKTHSLDPKGFSRSNGGDSAED
jgi:4-amino-4-deoxy-L-arabinose transferase-like glycosyltransferase